MAWVLHASGWSLLHTVAYFQKITWRRKSCRILLFQGIIVLVCKWCTTNDSYYYYGCLCAIGILWLIVAHWQWLIPSTNDVTAACTRVGLWHKCDAVECRIIYLQCSNNSGRPGRRDPTDGHSGDVGATSQVVTWLGCVRAGGHCTMFDWRLVADTFTATAGDLADRFWRDCHSCRQCDTRWQCHSCWQCRRRHHRFMCHSVVIIVVPYA